MPDIAFVIDGKPITYEQFTQYCDTLAEIDTRRMEQHLAALFTEQWSESWRRRLSS